MVFYCENHRADVDSETAAAGGAVVVSSELAAWLNISDNTV